MYTAKGICETMNIWQDETDRTPSRTFTGRFHHVITFSNICDSNRVRSEIGQESDESLSFHAKACSPVCPLNCGHFFI